MEQQTNKDIDIHLYYLEGVTLKEIIIQRNRAE